MFGLIILSGILWLVFSGPSNRSWGDEKKRLYRERMEMERNRNHW
jgi:hypothetical protein